MMPIDTRLVAENIATLRHEIAALRSELAALKAHAAEADAVGALVWSRAVAAEMRADGLAAENAALKAVEAAARICNRVRPEHRDHWSDCNVDWNDEPCNCGRPELRAALAVLDALRGTL